jgi:hypothetical protein
MLHLTFTQEEIEELHYQRYHHPHLRVQMKMEALLLKANGLPHHQIARLALASVKTPCGPTSSNTRLAALRRSKSCSFITRPATGGLS